MWRSFSALNRPDEVLKTTVEGQTGKPDVYALAGIDRDKKEFVLKAVNRAGRAAPGQDSAAGACRDRSDSQSDHPWPSRPDSRKHARRPGGGSAGRVANHGRRAAIQPDAACLFADDLAVSRPASRLSRGLWALVTARPPDLMSSPAIPPPRGGGGRHRRHLCKGRRGWGS